MLAQHDETAMHQIIEVVSQILQKHGMNDPVPVDVDLAREAFRDIGEGRPPRSRSEISVRLPP